MWNWPSLNNIPTRPNPGGAFAGALALQMEATLPIVNPKTVTASVEDIHSKADSCVGNLTSRVELDKFLDETKK